MTIPFKVKAIYEYRSEEADDLTFNNGQIITVTEDDDADWYTGEYTNAAGEKVEGIFPRNFVEKYEPAIPTRPSRAPKKAPQPELVATDDPVSAPEQEPKNASPVATAAAKSFSPPPAAAPPAAHEPAKEAEIEPPKQFTEPAPVSRTETQATSAEPKVTSEKKKPPPPVVEKPSSFKDRIAAFNKPAAAPVTPFKPSSASSGTSFIKKPFVAPPPSRNAYVPPPREQPQKIYRREEQDEDETADLAQDTQPPPRPVIASERDVPEDEDQPRTETLKERIARLQQQQLESAQRQADATKKKDKPKKTAPKPRQEPAEAEDMPEDENADLERVSTERRRVPSGLEDEPVRRSTDDSLAAPTPPMPSRELVSDTNDADDSGAADTEDPQDISTEEERPRQKSVKSPPIEQAAPAENEENEESTEEEEDPEVRRKRELRERMAKMSGGMGMMGMFGAGAAPASAPRKAKTPKEEKQQDFGTEEDVQRAPPVPIMALPGMAQSRPTKPAPPSEADDDSAQPTPVAAHEAGPEEDDYISQRPSRRSTEKSQPTTPGNRALPVPVDRPEPPQSPGARPVPPPPPPTKAAGELPMATHAESSDDEPEMPVAPPPPSNRPLPPPPPQPQSPQLAEAPRAPPPIPMSPTSPSARAPPPPPPTLPRRGTTELKDDSDEEVTEYDGDYDTDIASSAKHKAALKAHNRDSSLDEGALSDEAPNEPGVPPPAPARGAPPPIPGSVPRDAPPPAPSARDAPPLPPQAPPRSRESVDVPRAAPPPIPTTQLPPRPRESVDSPRAAPPPIPPATAPVDEDEEDYDPYRHDHSRAPGMPSVMPLLRKPTEEFERDYLDTRDDVPDAPRSLPPPPHSQVTQETYNSPEAISMSGALSTVLPKRSTDLGRSNSRRSADVARSSLDQAFIAADIDLGQASMWWTKENNPPPSLQNRNDVMWEVESTTNSKRGGRTSVSRDVYVLYQDYSQTTVNATYDATEPSHVSFEQTHERPPMPPRKDQLENASEEYGAKIAKAAEKAANSTIGEGTAQEFVLSLIRPYATALLPVGTRAYGAPVYANLANASTQQFDEIRPGDVITFRNAKFSGHKGGLHSKYNLDIANHVGIVSEWDGTKKKIRTWEQGNSEKGKKNKVRDESYRVGDLKSGEVRVWRVMPRSFVNWGTS